MAKWLDVNQIRDRVRIEDIIGMTYELVRVGQNDWRAKDHPSLSVNPVKQVYCWHSHGDDDSGTVVEWVMNRLKCTFREALEQLDDMISDGAAIQVKTQPEHRPAAAAEPVSHPVTDAEVTYYANMLMESQSAIKWLSGRHISMNSARAYRLGYLEDYYGKGPATTIPVYDNGALKTIRLRMWDNNATPRYRPIRSGLGAWMMNDRLIQADTKYVVIVEGEIKSIILNQFDIPAVGLMGNSLKSEWMERFPKQKRIYVWLDPDINPHDKSWVNELAALHGDVHVIRSVAKPDDAMIVMQQCAQDYWNGIRGSAIKVSAKLSLKRIVDPNELMDLYT